MKPICCAAFSTHKGGLCLGGGATNISAQSLRLGFTRSLLKKKKFRASRFAITSRSEVTERSSIFFQSGN